MAENSFPRCAFFGLCLLLHAAHLPAQPAPETMVEGRTVFHQDDSRTESVKDLNTRELTEMTYNAAGQLTTRKVFLLNDQGQTTQGNIYDGQGNLVARCKVYFDDFGRIQEERMSNLKGGVFQRIIHQYGADGKKMPPKVIHLDAEKPTMRSQMIDFTKLAPQTSETYSGEAVPVPQQIQAPTPAPSAAGAGEQEGKKPSFWKRLFGKKDKK
jgi:hypothetical protein